MTTAVWCRLLLAFLVVLRVGALPAGAADPAAARRDCAALSFGVSRSESLAVDGLPRTYLVHIAPHPAGTRLSVVFAFHGRGETPELLERYSGLSRLPFMLVYPRGLPGRGGKLSWSGTPAAAPGVDDIAFVRAILALLDRSPCIAAKRVYATGKSDGGGFAVQLACAAADRFAAVAPVAGAYYPIAGGCRPVRPVALLEMHGTGDRVVPYRGSAARGLPDIAAWLREWAARDGCTGSGRQRRVASAVAETAWANCARGTRVVGYRIAGGGHTWPGALAPSGPGVVTGQIDATALIGRFFAGVR